MINRYLIYRILTAWGLTLTLSFSLAYAATKNTSSINVASPYLASHASDLVKWQTWNKSTLQHARKSGKLILLSSGYYACRFCHVMKQESFENPDIAAYINKHFIPVLIDREMNPILDAQMQQFMQASGAPQGWPLNLILTSTTHPLVGTVYQAPDVFLNFLNNVQQHWQHEAKKLQKTAEAASQHIINNAQMSAFLLDKDHQKGLRIAFEQQVLLVADQQYGGFGKGAKYPMSPQLNALLQLQKDTPNTQLATHLQQTLNTMANSGLRDPLDGGFFRYTTDNTWQNPHYEKMLYDNAQLASVYLNAAHILNRPEFTNIAEQSLAFLRQTFLSNNGGFIASLSAVDDKGVDGGYYLWSEKELRKQLNNQEYTLVTKTWQQVESNEPEKYFLPAYPKALISKEKLSEKNLIKNKKQLRAIHKKIKTLRQQRNQPVDNKYIAGWNGLTLSAFSQAAKLTGKKEYQQTADKLYQFINKNLLLNKVLQRSAKGGSATLSDYAYTIAGLLEYAKLTNKAAHYQQCSDLITQAWTRFYLDGFWRQSETLDLLLPFTTYPTSLPDTELPSPSASLIQSTLAMSKHIDQLYIKKAQQALPVVNNLVVESPFFYATQITSLVKQHGKN